MRRLALLLLLAGIALGASAKTVTVAQLEEILTAAHGRPDAKIAQQLSELELSERLSAAKLSRWEMELPGAESRRSLVVLADLSTFLDPPAAEIPATATPDLATQRQMLALTVDYASKTIHQLPNFFATRDTIRFEDSPEGFRADTSAIPYQPLRPVGRASDTVLYRDGNEVVDSGAKGKKPAAAPGLVTQGVFGPILATVLVDAAHGKMAWSHWEQGASGAQAVYHYSVAREKSHYQVEFCCVPGDKGNGVFQEFSGYHGVIAVDPVSGAILRLTLEADLKPDDPLARSDIAVEYGAVEIGGKTYICPLKSVSVLLAPPPSPGAVQLQRYRGGALLEKDRRTEREHMQTLLNDVAFEQYHLFHAEARLINGNHVEPEGHAADGEATGADRADLAAEGEKAKDVSTSEAPAPTAKPQTSSIAPVSVQPAAAEPATEEIAVSEATGLPEVTTMPSTAQEKNFTLRVTTRLVDVNVVAFDKKGHPVTDLNAEDFEIYDNGRKEVVQFSRQTGGDAAKQSDHATGEVFSNRRADVAGTTPSVGAAESNVTILMIDAGGLAWADLTYAREEMLRFLRTLPVNERVGLYATKGQGVQILEEATTDHDSLASKLRQWMPSAQELARTQEMEQRNRQQFDEVRNTTDLQYVNGNNNSAPESANSVDPQLREEGSNPGYYSLSILTGAARHLSAIPGHKNLVWVSSDNVLVDWSDKAAGSDKGSRHIDGMVLRAQEALNNAHVSVYPLDASQLETEAIDAGLKNRNIELDPGVTGPPRSQSGGAQTGRIGAEMQQDSHPIQASIQEMAEATGGRAFRRSGDMAAELNSVVEDGRATYLLSFAPDVPADDQYHQLTVKLTTRRGVVLRYRTGYQYSQEPSTLKERFRQAIWQSLDVSDITVSANPIAVSDGATLKLNIAANDLAWKQQEGRWVDKLDIFLVQRNDEGLSAGITGQTLGMALKPATYQKFLVEGVQFNQHVEKKPGSAPLRIVVVDENSGRIGSVTVPATVLQAKP